MTPRARKQDLSIVLSSNETSDRFLYLAAGAKYVQNCTAAILTQRKRKSWERQTTNITDRLMDGHDFSTCYQSGTGTELAVHATDLKLWCELGA